MMMEGSKTGIEKVVTAVEKREAVQSRPAATERKPSTVPTPPDASLANDRSEKDQAKIRKLEAEIKKLQANLKDKNAENSKLNEKIDDLENSLTRQQAENERMLEKLKALNASNTAKNAELENLQAALDRHERGSGEASAELRELARRLEEANSRFLAAEQRWVTEKATFEANHNKLKDEHTATKSALELAQRKAADEISAWKNKHEKFDAEWREARDREANLRSDALKAKQQLAESEKKLAEWRQTVETCNAYIVNICQPSFSVVKDETLAPVPPGSPEGSGYVLVPLPLLLEGYGLLPGDMKKKIAQDYENSKKDLGEGGTVAAVQPAAPEPSAPRNGAKTPNYSLGRPTRK
jgi:hypothetical protein